MIKRFTAVAAVILAVCICLSSCTVLDFFSVESLIRAPKITGEYSLLQSAFESTAGGGTTVVAPVAGEYRSAYSLTDIDGDGIDEALVFYSRGGAEEAVRMNLLVYSSKQWKSIGDISGNGSGVYEVSFCDFDGDTCKEIAVVWSTADSGASDRTMTVFSVSGGKGVISGFSSLASIQVDSFMFHDFCAGGGEEIFYLCHEGSSKQSGLYTQLLTFGEGGGVPNPVSRISLDSAVASVEKMRCEENASGSRIFLDCKNSSGAFFTEIIDFNEEKSAFSKAPGAVNSYASGKTSRTCPLYCTDIDGDGTTEIPADIAFCNGAVLKNSQGRSASMIEWRELSDGDFGGKVKYFVNFNDGYRLCMDSLYDIAYITYDSSSRTARWYRADGSRTDSPSSGILFSVIFTGRNPDEAEEDNYLIVVTGLGEEMNIKSSYISSLIEPLS